jgi:hypothetical protein
MRNPHQLALLALLLARLVLGFTYSAINPLGEAPDEADHYAYAAAIGREGRLPVGSEMTQAKHPPLYHILAGYAGRPGGFDFSFLRSNPDVSVLARGLAPNFFIHTSAEDWPWSGGPLSMHLGRLISVLAGILLVAVTYGLGRQLWPAQPVVALMAAAFVAFLPESLFVGGSMSNDMLAATSSALMLLAALMSWPPHWGAEADPDAPSTSLLSAQDAAGRVAFRAAILTGGLMALAFLTKVSTVALWPIAVLLLILPPGRSAWHDLEARNAIVRRLPLGVLASLVAVAGVAPWLWRNWQLYRDPMGTPLVLATIDQRTGPLTLPDLAWLFEGWFLSFWGKFGGAGHILLPATFYVAWGAIVLAAGGGWLVRWRRHDPLHPSPDADGWLILAAAPLLTIVTMVAYSRIALGTDQGRLLFPALAPIGLLIAGGVAGWQPRLRGCFAGAWTAGLAALAVLALVWGLVIPFAPPPEPSASEVAGATLINATWLDLTLHAVDWPADAAPVLYWRASARISKDLRVAVRVLGADDTQMWEWRRSPGAGRYSTDRWPVHRFVADAYILPPDTVSAARRIDVGVYEFGSDVWLTPEGGESRPFASFEVPLP